MGGTNTIELGKDAGTRVDFKPDQFDRLVRQKGYKLYWSRAILCPCKLNDKTDQADPTCTVCFGDGYFYVHPDPGGDNIKEYVAEADVANHFLDLDVDSGPHSPKGKATQGILLQMTQDPQIFEKFGEWLFGTSKITTYSFNRVGYRDRFEVIDSLMRYQEIVTLPEDRVIRPGRLRDNIRYTPVVLLNIVTVDGTATDVKATATINADGTITFSGSTPSAGTRLCVVYEFHPVFIMVEHLYAIRDTLVAFKTTNELGEHKEMVRQAMVRLDFLVGG